MKHPETMRAVAKLARLHNMREKPPAGEFADARRNLATAKIAAAIEDALLVAPPLLPEQRNRLVALLDGGAATDA